MNIQEQTEREEFVRNLNHNYLRVHLSEKPEEKKFQYCILQRGGIGHLLPCDLRYINDEAFLYYDITSLQNLCQIFRNRKVDRKWFGDFLWGMQKVQVELNRFLLEKEHLVWGPEHVFQDYEKNDFYFQFIPYENHEDTFRSMLDFMIEKLDYKDESFVEFIYGIYEKYDQIGTDFIVEKIHEEYEFFLESEKSCNQKSLSSENGKHVKQKILCEENIDEQNLQGESEVYRQPVIPERRKRDDIGIFGKREQDREKSGERDVHGGELHQGEINWGRGRMTPLEDKCPTWKRKLHQEKTNMELEGIPQPDSSRRVKPAWYEKGGFFSFFHRNTNQKNEEKRDIFSEGNIFREQVRNQFYQEDTQTMVSEPATQYGGADTGMNYRDEKIQDYIDKSMPDYADGMGEETEYGKTVYIENDEFQKDRGLYKENGELLIRLTEFPFVVGKKRDEVQYAFTHPSISRIHARFLFENGEYFLEDINSTNGSFKNGLRLHPYEKKKLEIEDEIRFGSLVFTFR